MNLNAFAKRVCLREGGKRNLNIADVKEVIRCVSVELYSQDFEEMRNTFERMMRSAAKRPKKVTRR